MNIDELEIGPSDVALTLDENSSSSKNPFTGGSRITRMPGAHWSLVASWSKLQPHEGNFLDAYLASTQGGASLMRVRDLSYTHPTGVRNGAVTTSGAASDGNTLATTGWAANVAGQLRIGDRFSFIDPVTGLEHLYVISFNANSDGGGNALLQFFPELRILPPPGTPINILSPGFSARGTKGKVSRAGMAVTASITWEEAIYAV